MFVMLHPLALLICLRQYFLKVLFTDSNILKVELFYPVLKQVDDIVNKIVVFILKKRS